ncbi:hypothetical protein ACFVJW_22495 [Streptomyces libani]|uniref:hypothetical protein n=1 Tax=Streptomyces nigrescens TaxID=1920 RepID=UPI0036370A20
MADETRNLPSVDQSLSVTTDDVDAAIERWAEAQAKAAPHLNEEQLEILRELFG